MKKIILASVLVCATIFNAGCTDGEVAAGAIGVIIGIGLGGDNGHDHHRPPPYHPRRPRHYDAVAAGSAAGSTEVATVTTEENPALLDFALKYNISLEAAEKVNAAFQGVQTEGTSSFAKIGLNQSDIKTIMRHELPSSSAIKSLAGKLDMSEAQARDFLVSLNKEFQAQAEDVTSPYWQSCMAKGKWKTPQNLYCKSTSWNGCAPESGATLCY